MRQETKIINYYKFDELSDKAKDQAIDWYRQHMEDDYQWEFDCVIDDAKGIFLKIESLDQHKPNRGSFIFSATSCADKIIKDHGPDCETYKTASDYLQKTAAIASCIHPDNQENEIEEMQNDLESEFLQSLLEDYRIILDKNIEYRNSNEAIIETIQANEYEFTESGERI